MRNSGPLLNWSSLPEEYWNQKASELLLKVCSIQISTTNGKQCELNRRSRAEHFRKSRLNSSQWTAYCFHHRWSIGKQIIKWINQRKIFQLIRRLTFTCPCSYPLNVIHSAVFILGPSMALFIIGIMLNSTVWRLVHGCMFRWKLFNGSQQLMSNILEHEKLGIHGKLQ